MKNTFNQIRDDLRASKARSAWVRGVIEYALELVDIAENRSIREGREPENREELRTWMLNGAKSWYEFSAGGCSLIYDSDIARRLCTPSELRITREGERAPNKNESWLEVQARALSQASGKVKYSFLRIREV